MSKRDVIRWIPLILLACWCFLSATIGGAIGMRLMKGWQDRWYYEHCLHVAVAPDDSDATHEFGGYISGPQGCSDDGRTWWPAHIHQDGTIECLASDKPAPYARKP